MARRTRAGSASAREQKAAEEARQEERQEEQSTVPERIFAQASPHSAGGVPLFAAQERISSGTVANFLSPDEMVTRAAARLQDAGFEVLQLTRLTINIAGSRQTYERAFNTEIVASEQPTLKEQGREDTATVLDSPDTATPGLISTVGTPFADVLEGVALEVKRYYFQPSMYAPTKAYWHLRLPGDVSLACNADKVHRLGITGRGVRVAMVDSGWYRHPYFVGRGYRAAPVVLGPGSANPLADEIGHGTGESANIFAVAPDVELLPVKANLVNLTADFNAAVALNPDIITCSWGLDRQNPPLFAADQALAAAVAAAVAAGIIVIFSAGNGHFGFPGQHPDVISAGGVFVEPNGSLRASDYASGFASNIYPGRRVPDLCGLVGMRPRAAYLMLPLEPGDQIDRDLAGGRHPNADETAANDGWAAFSGTSAAAPHLAGVAALVRQACARLRPAEVRQILVSTARDVRAGTCNPRTGGHAATAGADLATGTGLVDAHRAVMIARVRCLGPIRPIQPVQPVQPVRPIPPVQPVEPIAPVGPIRPIQPVQPVQPIQPIQPIEPIRPIRPIEPIEPIRPIQPPVREAAAVLAEDASAGIEAAPLTAEDVQALEDIVLQDPDFELDI